MSWPRRPQACISFMSIICEDESLRLSEKDTGAARTTNSPCVYGLADIEEHDNLEFEMQKKVALCYDDMAAFYRDFEKRGPVGTD